MLKKLNKKKKGFTLIELVIVLAVLAIIALIAIPNFTKVRNDSLMKADSRTGEQIEKITLMAIADQDIKLPTGSDEKIIISFGGADPAAANANVFTGTGKSDYEDMIKEVKKPQVNNQTTYEVFVDKDGNVEVTYGSAASIVE